MNEVHSPKKPLIFYYMVAMLLVMLFNFIAMPWLSQYQIQEDGHSGTVACQLDCLVSQLEAVEEKVE